MRSTWQLLALSVLLASTTGCHLVAPYGQAPFEGVDAAADAPISDQALALDGTVRDHVSARDRAGGDRGIDSAASDASVPADAPPAAESCLPIGCTGACGPIEDGCGGLKDCFCPDPVTLTVTVENSSQPTYVEVLSSPPGLACYPDMSCNASFQRGTTVTLDCDGPDVNAALWSGDGTGCWGWTCELLLDDHKSVTIDAIKH